MFHFKDVCFGVYFVHFKFIPELFILFLCVSISIRALRLSFVDLEHIASVFESECLTSHNFDRNGAPYLRLFSRRSFLTKAKSLLKSG